MHLLFYARRALGDKYLMKSQSFQFFMDSLHEIRSFLFPFANCLQTIFCKTDIQNSEDDMMRNMTMASLFCIEISSFEFRENIGRSFARRRHHSLLCVGFADTTSFLSCPALHKTRSHSSTMYANLITDDGIMTSFQYC